MAIWTTEIKQIENLNESIRGQFLELEKELEQLIRTEDANVIMLYSRRCLEVIITDLCECELKRPRKTEPLKGIIDKLHKEEKVPSHIITSMHGLNELSTYGTHPKDFDPEQIKPVLNNLNIIIKWYLKFKESGTEIKATSAEVNKQEVKSTENVNKSITISKKRLTVLLFGLILLIVIVVAVLLFTNIIGSGKQTKELEKSIAVLPFMDMSPEKDQDYFCDGITEEIINALTQIKNFKVIARTSVFAFKDKQADLHEIGRKLDVETILEGSIQKDGNRLRITTQLIKVADGSHIWSERYDRDLKDVFAIQDEIASNIVEKLRLTSFGDEKEKLSKHQAIDPIAYEAYLKGSYYWWRWSEEDHINAIKCFQKVIEIEPDYAPAHAGLALTYLFASTWNNIGLWSPQEGVSKSKEAVQKAIQLDPMLADGYVARGFARMVFDLNWVAAEMDFKRALELSPNSSLALDAYANFLFLAQGKFNEAFTELKKAQTIDPLSAALYSDLGVFYYMSGQMDQAIPSFRKALELDSNFFWAHLDLAYIDLFKGDTIKALDKFQNLVKLTPSSPYSQEALGYAYGISGYRDKAQEVLSNLDKLAMTRYVPPSAKAFIYIGLGEKDAALDYLDKAYEERDTEIIFLNVDPPFLPLRSEPRFLALLKKVGFNN
jgi:TolB-like protein/tetratricopeptide (TPR) repeat protein